MQKLSISCVYSDNPYCAAVGFSDGVTSANTVGYSTITLPAGIEYNLIAIPFDAVATGGTLTLADVFGENALAAGFRGGNTAATSDQLQFWDGSGYKMVWLNGNDKATALYKKWLNYGATGWGNNNQPTTKTLKGGESFWIKRAIPAGQTAASLPALSLVVSGQVIVKQGGVTEFDIIPGTGTADGYTLVSAGFTAPFIPNPDKVDNTKSKINWIALGCHGGNTAATSDQLQIWDGQSYKMVWLNGNDKAPALYGYWLNYGSTGWGNNNQPTTVQIDPTVGFWYLRNKSATTTFKFQVAQPYSL